MARSLQPPAKSIKKEILSQDQIVDSDSEEETRSPAQKASKPSKAVTTTQDSTESEDDDDDSSSSNASDSDSSSVSSSSEAAQTPATSNKLKRKAGDGSLGNDESSPNGGSVSVNKRAKLVNGAEDVEMGEEEQDLSTDSPSRASTSIFEPPRGFHLVQKLGNYPAAQDLANKQIWIIKAPSDLSLSDITKITPEAIHSHAPVLQHEAVDYMLKEDKESESQLQSFLVPTRQGYIAAPQVDAVFHIQQKVELPRLSKRQSDINTGSNAAARIGQASIKEIRPQPKGLRMRYKPPASGLEGPSMMISDSSDDEDRDPVTAMSQFPAVNGLQANVITQGDTATKQKSPKKKRLPGEKNDNRESSITSNMEASEESRRLEKQAKKLRKEERRKREGQTA